jgi:pimeloyl-ACP methyl ester carboxylesterase
MTEAGMPFTVQTVSLSTGVTVPYVEQGAESAVPVLLLHAYADSWRFFEPLLHHLPPSVHVYAFTQRGHGDAERPRDGYRPEDFAADAAAFMDAVGVESAVLAGQSSGGYIAQRFAIDHPARTRGLVLISTPRDFRDKPAELVRTVSELTDPVDPNFVREFVQSTITQPVPLAYLETLIAESSKVPARVWKVTLDGLFDADVPIESGTIAVPTLLLWGDRDELCSRSEQEALATAIAGAELVIYPGTGHLVAGEQPARTAANIVDFTQRLDSIGLDATLRPSA